MGQSSLRRSQQHADLSLHIEKEALLAACHLGLVRWFFGCFRKGHLPRTGLRSWTIFSQNLGRLHSKSCWECLRAEECDQDMDGLLLLEEFHEFTFRGLQPLLKGRDMEPNICLGP